MAVARSTAEAPTKLPGTIDETAALIRALGRRVLAISADLSTEEACLTAAAQAYEVFGRVDVLINNAAISPVGPALTAPLRRWRLAVDVNLNAPFALMHEICPRMAAAGYGRVINISSSDAVSTEAGRVSYTTTKRALEGMSESLAHELLGTGVTVHALRLELDVWSEGFAFTLGPDADTTHFEDPVIMSDACLWLASQPDDYSGRIVTIGELRRLEVVRPTTRVQPERRVPGN